MVIKSFGGLGRCHVGVGRTGMESVVKDFVNGFYGFVFWSVEDDDE